MTSVFFWTQIYTRPGKTGRVGPLQKDRPEKIGRVGPLKKRGPKKRASRASQKERPEKNRAGRASAFGPENRVGSGGARPRPALSVPLISTGFINIYSLVPLWGAWLKRKLARDSHWFLV